MFSTLVESRQKTETGTLAFGGVGLLRTNDPAVQEKTIVYNEFGSAAECRRSIRRERFINCDQRVARSTPPISPS
jgi:hypothetical protein